MVVELEVVANQQGSDPRAFADIINEVIKSRQQRGNVMLTPAKMLQRQPIIDFLYDRKNYPLKDDNIALAAQQYIRFVSDPSIRFKGRISQISDEVIEQAMLYAMGENNLGKPTTLRFDSIFMQIAFDDYLSSNGYRG